jgi:DNA-binding IclR family transcriptional regulator
MNSCNVFSISEATGIPRETVRRKVGQLLKKGLLYRDEHKRLMVRSGVSAGFAKRNAETTEEILALAAKLQSLLNTANSQDD